MTDDQRELLAMILEDAAKSGLPGHRDLDVAFEAIACAFAPPAVACGPTGEPVEEIAAADIPKPPVRTSLQVDRDTLHQGTVFRVSVAEQNGRLIERYGFSVSDGKKRGETDPIETVVFFRWMADRIEQHFNPEQRLASRNRYEIERRKWEGR